MDFVQVFAALKTAGDDLQVLVGWYRVTIFPISKVRRNHKDPQLSQPGK